MLISKLSGQINIALTTIFALLVNLDKTKKAVRFYANSFFYAVKTVSFILIF